MPSMVMTLDVSQLSGWLNTDAPCRVESEACGKRGGMCGAGRREGRGAGGGGASSVRREYPNCGDRAGRARPERTANMACMVVTLDVSKLSGWLNTDALCRVERQA